MFLVSLVKGIYCSGWCGKSHTLSYPGYATAIASYPIEVLSSTYMVLKWIKDKIMTTAVVSIPMTVVEPIMT